MIISRKSLKKKRNKNLIRFNFNLTEIYIIPVWFCSIFVFTLTKIFYSILLTDILLLIYSFILFFFGVFDNDERYVSQENDKTKNLFQSLKEFMRQLRKNVKIIIR